MKKYLFSDMCTSPKQAEQEAETYIANHPDKTLYVTYDTERDDDRTFYWVYIYEMID